MSIYELDKEREMRLIREDEREIGRESILALNKLLLADKKGSCGNNTLQ